MILLILLHTAHASDCSRLWACDAPTIPQTRRHFPGHCGPRAAGLRLGMGPAWPRRCVREFMKLLFDTCGVTTTPIEECVNLAPAGSGTTTLVEALKASGSAKCASTDGPCWHHHHSNLGIREALARAPCALITSREPASRIESGHAYWRASRSIDEALETARRARIDPTKMD